MSIHYSFASVLVHHPYVVLISLAVFSGSCLIIPLSYRTLPNFSDPQMGFETRGTPLADRITTWKVLLESAKSDGPFAANPKEYMMRKNFSQQFKPKRKKNMKKIKTQGIVREKMYFNESRTSNRIRDSWHTLERIIKEDSRDIILPPLNKNGFFCGHPTDNYAQIVIKADDDGDLFTLENLFRICRLEMELVQTEGYKPLCVTMAKKPKNCCRPWSLSNYIAVLNGRTSCLAITDNDVDSTKKILQRCAKYFHSLKLAPDCLENIMCTVPRECIRHNAVFNILNYITSTTFLPPNDNDQTQLQETTIFLPIACSTATLSYYYNLADHVDHLSYKGVSIVAMEFGLKNRLFDERLFRDAWLMGVGGIFVIVCMWLYTGSLFLTIMTIIAIVFSLGISYFLYTLVFELGFFPFMNLLATIVAIGIGADDAFIFCKVWNTAKEENRNSLVKVMSHTLYHALISMLVTSMTTAVAFLASYLSSITALRCFGIFAGMAVFANYILMISWLPATIVLWERYCLANTNIMKSCLLVCLERWCCSAQWKLSVSKLRTTCAPLDKIWSAPETYIPDAIIRFKFIFFISLTAVAVISSIVVFYYPRLQLPTSNEFQLLDSDHPFEQYDMVYKHRFWYKRTQKAEDIDGNLNTKLPLRFVWGVLPRDNGNHLNPQSLGNLEMDPSFNMSLPESQQFLRNFCKDLRSQPFYQPTRGLLLPNCFIESFIKWMGRRCVDSLNDNFNRTPCCEISKFPYEAAVFDTCILDAISDLYETPSEYFIPGVAGPKFSKDEFPVIKAVVVEYDSNYTYSMSYDYMRDFTSQVDSWLAEELTKAPDGMKGGWFISEFEFYDLQRVLSEHTFMAIVISMALALIVLLVSTLNVLNSLYAIFTITCSIVTTMAVLVLLGWKLNVLESVAISSTIGLTIDFSLHYAVHYKLCPMAISKDRERAVQYSLKKMLAPTLMAAITTLAVGAIMTPSAVLAYRQIGHFLVIVMVVSWVYATFHLCPLLAMAGPQGQFGQYTHADLLFCRKQAEHKGRTEPKPAESVGDSHELESLGSKRSHGNLQRSFSAGGRSHGTRHNFSDQSPSATSAITIIMADDN